MTGTFIGVVVGGLISWAISHLYYKKSQERNPTPLIREMNTKVQELYRLADKRRDREMQRKLKELSEIMTETHLDILHSLLPFHVDIKGLYEVYKSGDKEKFYSYAEEAIPELAKFEEKLISIRDELQDLRSEVSNMKVSDSPKSSRNAD